MPSLIGNYFFYIVGREKTNSAQSKARIQFPLFTYRHPLSDKRRL